jgi:hypothetical protein
MENVEAALDLLEGAERRKVSGRKGSSKKG